MDSVVSLSGKSVKKPKLQTLKRKGPPRPTAQGQRASSLPCMAPPCLRWLRLLWLLPLASGLVSPESCGVSRPLFKDPGSFESQPKPTLGHSGPLLPAGCQCQGGSHRGEGQLASAPGLVGDLQIEGAAWEGELCWNRLQSQFRVAKVHSGCRGCGLKSQDFIRGECWNSSD